MLSAPRSLGTSFLALVALSACADEPPTSVVLEDLGSAPELGLLLPEVGPADLVVSDSVVSEVTDAPLRADTKTEEYEDYTDAVATIYDEDTFVGITPDYAYSWGQHWYLGNKSRIVTTAKVAYSGSPLGSQTATREAAGLFLIDGPQVKYLSTSARVYTDHECGLSVTGTSKHSAWWEWYLGFSVPSWGLTEKPSEGGPKSQDPCAGSSDSGWGDATGGSSAVCYVSIAYDEGTGEVLSYDVLFCTSLTEQIGG